MSPHKGRAFWQTTTLTEPRESLASSSNLLGLGVGNTLLAEAVGLGDVVGTSVDFLLNGVNVNVCNLSIFTIEDLGDFLKSGTTGLNHHEVDEDQFNEDPDLKLYVSRRTKSRREG